MMRSGNWWQNHRAAIVFIFIGTLVGTALLVLGIEWKGPFSKGDATMILLGVALLFAVAWVAIRMIGGYALSRLLDRLKQKKA
jgi:hypothetical protein